MNQADFHPVLPLADLPEDARKRLDVAGHAILLCNHDDRIFAIAAVCTHAEEPLECGRIRNGWIACPVHGARFDLETGEALNPPASAPIRTYAVRVVDEMIEVAL